MCSVARSETCKGDWKLPIYPNDQRWLVARSTWRTHPIILGQELFMNQKTKYLKYNKVIKWFVLLLWSVRPWKKKFCWIRVARVFHILPPLPLIKWPVSLAWATSKPSQGSWACRFIKVDANLHQFTLTRGAAQK